MFFEDLTPFFNAAEFADDATLDGGAVCGIFEKNYMVSDPGCGMLIAKLAFILPTSAVPASPNGKLLVIGAVTYAVAGIDPDGTDRVVTALILEKTV